MAKQLANVQANMILLKKKKELYEQLQLLVYIQNSILIRDV